MNFGNAIEALKQRKKVARAGWDDKTTWLFLVPDQSMLLLNNSTTILPMGPGELLAPWIAMKTTNGPIVPWVASHYDMLAENWHIVTQS